MLEGYSKLVFSSDAVDGRPLEHDVYVKGDGPVVLIIQELPGIGPQMLKLADRLVAEGFRVVMPHLFGPIGRLSFVGNGVRLLCMRREFALFARNKTSPVVAWLKALCQRLRLDYDVPGIGVIGMCLSGNFAISLMADDAVLASVASQPSLPLFAPSALHMSQDDIGDIRRRLDRHGPMLAYRFSGDKMCPAEKFAALDKAFNDDRERIRLKSLPGNGHAVLTVHFNDEEGSPTAEALTEILAYFRQKLLPEEKT